MSETLQDRIMRHEGFCAVPKVDVPPMYVIGFGHDITKQECENYPHGILYADAEKLLESDIEKCIQEANAAFPWMLGLDDIRQSVIIEMVFQLGLAGVQAFKIMISAVRMQDWQIAYNNMLWEDSACTKPTPWYTETPARCEELANLMLKGYSES